jgi:hypothetical protein
MLADGRDVLMDFISSIASNVTARLEHFQQRQPGVDDYPVRDSNDPIQPNLTSGSRHLHLGHGFLDLCLSVLVDLDPAVQKVRRLFLFCSFASE